MRFFYYLNSRRLNIKLTFEKQNSGKFAFLDILISNENHNFCASVFPEKAPIGLYTNFTSFTPFSYKIGLIKTLLHRDFEISSSWNSLDQEKRQIKNLLMKNLYPSRLIDKEIKTFLENKLTTKENTNIDHTNKSVSYYKLPYIGSYSNSTKKKIHELRKTFCENTNLKIAFSPFKLQDLFSSKDCLPVALKSFVVYKFTCAGCQSCYIRETKRHLPTRIKKHLQNDTKSHILQHLNENPRCRDLCDDSYFIIIDDAPSSFRSKLKEALQMTWLKPVLNKQKNQLSIIILV